MNNVSYINEPVRGNPQIPVQYPYGTNNLITATPYQNYMGTGNLTSQNQFLKCKPVTSKEQAIAFQIDLDGSLWVFPNIANGKIYTKQISNNGSAVFNTYTYTEEKEQMAVDKDNFVTKEQFNKVIQSIMAAIPTKVEDKRQY